MFKIVLLSTLVLSTVAISAAQAAPAKPDRTLPGAAESLVEPILPLLPKGSSGATEVEIPKKRHTSKKPGATAGLFIVVMSSAF